MLKVVTTVGRALAVYATLAFAEMIKNCMSQELSWKVCTHPSSNSFFYTVSDLILMSQSGPKWFLLQGPAKNWETVLLSLGVAGSEPGVEGEEIAPLAKENVATP